MVHPVQVCSYVGHSAASVSLDERSDEQKDQVSRLLDPPFWDPTLGWAAVKSFRFVPRLLFGFLSLPVCCLFPIPMFGPCR